MNFLKKLRFHRPKRDREKNENARLDQTTYSLSMKIKLGLIQSPEKKIAVTYALAYVIPLLWALIASIPVMDSNVGSLIFPFGYYAYLLPLSIVFFGPFLIPFSLGPLFMRQSSAYGPLAIPGYILFSVSFLLYPVVSYLLLRGHRAAWILSCISSLATIGLDVFVITNIPGFAAIWLFGIAVNILILYLLYSCRAEFFG